jgi:hypothetical protein
MASAFYNNFKKKIQDGSIDMDTDTIKLALTTSSYTPNIDSHDFFDDITNEVVGTGYTAGGYSLANKSVTVDTGNDRAVFDADDITSTNTTVTFRYGILYKSTGVAGTSPLIAVIDFSTDRVYTAETVLISWNSTGIFYLT